MSRPSPTGVIGGRDKRGHFIKGAWVGTASYRRVSRVGPGPCRPPEQPGSGVPPAEANRSGLVWTGSRRSFPPLGEPCRAEESVVAMSPGLLRRFGDRSNCALCIVDQLQQVTSCLGAEPIAATHRVRQRLGGTGVVAEAGE